VQDTHPQEQPQLRELAFGGPLLGRALGGTLVAEEPAQKGAYALACEGEGAIFIKGATADWRPQQSPAEGM